MSHSSVKRSPSGFSRWLWPALLALTLFIISSVEVAPESPFPGWMSPHAWAHILVYGLMATLILRCFQSDFLRPIPILTAFVLSSLYGAFDEWRQAFNPVRVFSFQDMLLNILGAAVAITAYSAWPSYRRLLELKVF